MTISIESNHGWTLNDIHSDLNLCLTVVFFRNMPKLNKLLVTSIIADIRECVHVSNEIYSWLGDIEHLSWKFPTKTAKDINAMEIVKEHEGTAGEFYILLLELAYDRLFNTFFLPSLVLYSLFVRSVSFRICTNSSHDELEDREEEFREGSCGSIRHANVS